jgi:hypothetical protein
LDLLHQCGIEAVEPLSRQLKASLDGPEEIHTEAVDESDGVLGRVALSGAEWSVRVLHGSHARAGAPSIGYPPSRKPISGKVSLHAIGTLIQYRLDVVI